MNVVKLESVYILHCQDWRNFFYQIKIINVRIKSNKQIQ